MKKFWIALFAVVGLALAAQAETIIRWSVPGGTNNIVTDSGPKGAAAGSTYAVVSPADGAGGYSTNVVGQTRIVYGASTKPWNNTLVQNLNPDYMQLVNNYSGAVGTFTTMLAWEDFLTTDSELESMTVMYGSRGGVGTTASFLIETSAGWYKSVQSNFVSAVSFTTWTLGVADLTWESFSDPGFSGITSGVGPADISDLKSAGVYFSAENSSGNNWAGTKVAYFEVTATAPSIVQSNFTYATIEEAAAVTRSNDLANVGQATFASSTVSANQGADTPEDGFNDGAASDSDFEKITWFHNGAGHLPAEIVLNLDVATNLSGYDISDINSIAGWGSGEQADQVMTVEYSVVGSGGFTSLGTFTNTAAGIGEYSRLNLTEESAGYLATGVDALRFTYAATGNHLLIQEIDVIGVAAEIVQPTVQLELASMFSDDMIVQREKAVPIWGTSTPGAAITVEFAGQTNTTTAAGDGTWQVDLDPMTASTNARTLTVTAELDDFETTVVSFSNILVGEVWLFSGQSNMAFVINQTVQRDTVELLPTNDRLRLFKVPMEGPSTPLERIDAVWTECNTGTGPGTADDFSAVAYNFGIKLQDELESSEGARDVPIGLIQSARGGSIVEKWLPAGTSYNGGAAGIHYNGMIDAIIPFAMRGVIWYQGENNVVEDQDATGYVAKKKTLIDGWRALWGYDFPFYYAQLAPYAYSENDKWNVEAGVLPLFWEAQSAVLGEVTSVGMAVASDHVTDLTGTVNFNEIHPRDKEPIAQRLALLALDNTYEQDIVSTGPVFQSLKTVGNTLEITFDSAVGLTTSDGLAPDWFELEVVDGVYTSAAAVVSNNMVVLSSPAVAVPTSMRFAWSQVAQPNLRNGAGLVASAFRAERNLYGQWIEDFGLSGSNVLHNANPDGDALNNLNEYAMGGNPTNEFDWGHVPVFGTHDENGTNWFEYVYARRHDAAARGLEYTVEATSNLLSEAWNTDNVTETGAEYIDSDFEAVTNRIPMEAEGFMRLTIELAE